MNTTKQTAASSKKPDELPPAEGLKKPATGSAAEAALKKDEKPEAAEVDEKEEKEEVPKEVPYAEPVMQTVPAANPAYKEPLEPPVGSRRLKDEQAAGRKTLEAIEANKGKETAPKPGTASAAPPPKK